MNDLAIKLNTILEETTAYHLLSEMGKRFFFPRGIVAQAAEATERAHLYNVTAGMAFKNKKPMILDSIGGYLSEFTTRESVSYAPTPGDKELRAMWKGINDEKNPTLKGKATSMPIVVPGLTNGIFNVADLFINPADNIVIPNYHWGNYDLIFETRKLATVKTFELFKADGINIEGLKKSLKENAVNNKVTVLLNFPNNPTGYSPNEEEVKNIAEAIKELAAGGLHILVISDDAYFGLFYEKETYKESIFSLMADLHENVLAVKVDGATKEDYVWGLRVGFVTFAGKGLNADHYNALEQKLMGSIRSSISSSSRLSQSIVKKAIQDPGYQADKDKKSEIMKDRYLKVKEILKNRTKGKALKEMPFNSGYFMSFETEPGFNELMRQSLLEKGIGTVALGATCLRVAFSSIDLENLEDLYDKIFEEADRLS